MPEPPTVAIATIAAELALPVDVVVARLGHAIRTDQAGCRAVPIAEARDYIDHHHEQVRAAQARLRERETILASCGNPIRERVRRLRAQAVVAADPNLDAYGAMISGTEDDKLATSATHLDEMMSGTAIYHRITREDD